MLKHLRLLSVVAPVGIMLGFQAILPDHKQAELLQRANKYREINSQIYYNGDPAQAPPAFPNPEKRSELRVELSNLVSEEILDLLGQPLPSVDRIKTAISTLQGEFALPVDPMVDTNTPMAKSFMVDGVRTFAFAYNFLEGGGAVPITHCYLQFYSGSHASWELASSAPTEEDFRGATFYMCKLQAGNSSEAWFLAWGTTIGDTGARLRARLYAYNGERVRTLWKRDGLSRGDLTVTPANTVLLSYEKVYNSSDPNNRVQEILHVTRNGLE